MMAHTLEYLVHAAQMAGQFNTAIETAYDIARLENGPAWRSPQYNWAVTDTLLRFHRWDQLLSQEPPGNPTIYRLVWQFSRVVALAASGRINDARREFSAYELDEAALPDEATWIGNPTRKLFPLMRGVMNAMLHRARGDRAGAVASWRAAVVAFDELQHWEYLSWYHPVRESLGAELFLLGRFQETEQVFREDLERVRGNPRSLFGLWRSLEAQGRAPEAAEVQQRFETSWRDADITLTTDDL